MMRLRPHRRNLVVWSQSAGPAARYGGLRLTRTRRIPRWIRTGALLTVIGLVGLARGMRARWRPLLAGVVLTVAGVIMRNSPASVILLPGMLLLLHALLIPARPEEDRKRLEQELGEYSTPAQRCDLEAVLDRYSDGITCELRDILSSQAMAADGNRFPAAGRY
jgi:hypothetical protein